VTPLALSLSPQAGRRERSGIAGRSGLVWALLLSGPLLSAEPSSVRVTALPAKSEVTVGETFLVEVRAEGPAGTSWTFAAEAGDEHVELRAAPPASPLPAAAASAAPPPDNVMRYEATLFALKDAAVPPVSVKYRLPDGTEGEARSEPVPLRVASLLPKDTKEQQLADIRGPLSLGIGRAFWIATALLAIALVTLIVWLVRRRRPRAMAVAPRTELTPDVEALQALAQLLVGRQLERGEYRPFYIVLTAIAKRYLERRLGAQVLEMTSAEMTAFLRDHPHGQTFVSPIRELSTAADQIKFAKGTGQHEQAQRHVQNVRDLIAGLEARLRPQAAPHPIPLPASRGEGSAAS